MSKQAKPLDNSAAGKALLKRELEQGLASGVSERTPDQIRTTFRKAREPYKKIKEKKRCSSYGQSPKLGIG